MRADAPGPLLLILALILLPLLLSAPESPPDATDWMRCLDCHPNQGSHLPMLSELRLQPGGPVAVGCSSCHVAGEIAALRSEWTHSVRPVGAHLACTQCHPAVPHSEDRPPPKPVGDYHPEGCYECHRDVDARRHMLAAHGDSGLITCIGCHPAHDPLSAALPAVLIPQAVRQQLAGAYDYYASNRACLICHPAAQLMSALSSGFVTLNTVNLHDIHVARGQSLCIECHEPHGGLQDAMLRSELLTREPLLFFPTAQGGNCTTVCHGVSHTSLGYVNKAFDR